MASAKTKPEEVKKVARLSNYYKYARMMYLYENFFIFTEGGRVQDEVGGTVTAWCTLI